MQCQLCDQPATVHLTEIVNGDKSEQHLCEDCAQKQGITIKSQHVPISQILDSVIAAQQTAEELSDVTCPKCGVTWAEFRKSGLLGCAYDYTAFAEPLSALIGRAHDGAKLHVGHQPRQAKGRENRQGRLLRLQHDLREALGAEDYEAAARIRDELGQLTSE